MCINKKLFKQDYYIYYIIKIHMLNLTLIKNNKYIIISLIIVIILFILYKKHQNEKFGDTIGDRRPTSYGFAWW
jgi:c-di-AMP phosphodiesterase-like protein